MELGCCLVNSGSWLACGELVNVMFVACNFLGCGWSGGSKI